MSLDDPWMIASGAAAAVASFAAATAGLVYLTRPVRRLAVVITDFLSDWNGEPARPGVPKRPGAMERFAGIENRLAVVESQVLPNHGRSLHDKVTAIAEATGVGDKP